MKGPVLIKIHKEQPQPLYLRKHKVERHSSLVKCGMIQINGRIPYSAFHQTHALGERCFHGYHHAT